MLLTIAGDLYAQKSLKYSGIQIKLIDELETQKGKLPGYGESLFHRKIIKKSPTFLGKKI